MSEGAPEPYTVTMTRREQLLSAAMDLPEGERYELGWALLNSCGEQDREWTPEEETEFDRVQAAIRSGEMKTSSWEEVRKRIAERLSGARDSIL